MSTPASSSTSNPPAYPNDSAYFNHAHTFIDTGPQAFTQEAAAANLNALGSGFPLVPQISQTQSVLNSLSYHAEVYPVAHKACVDVMAPASSRKHRKTGIICTIGPKTNSPQAIAMLRKSGMNIMRMNFSHGTHEYHGSVIDNLKKSFEASPGPPVAIALDTKGPEIRTGNMKPGSEEVELKAGSSVVVSVDPKNKNECDDKLIYVDWANLPNAVSVNSLIYIDDGLISLKVNTIAEDNLSVTCEVLNSGMLSSHKGVNLPGTVVDLPSVSEQDEKDLLFGVERQVDIIFASFIRKPADIHAIRKVLGEKGKRIFIIAKIENQEGLANFDSILEAADGIMVARGDLGIEIPVKKVFLAQKMMISRCNLVGKPVICATQMLESMTYNPRPTRAEASDVANAVIDGSDCVMLSGETAKGKYPAECVSMMHEICIEAEATLHFKNFFNSVNAINKMKHTNETLAAAAVQAAFEQRAAALIVMSVTGSTARLVAKYRPPCPIICVTTDDITSRQLHLSRGVFPVLFPYNFPGGSWSAYIDSMVKFAIEQAFRQGEHLLQRGDVAVVVQGWASNSGHTNTLRVIRI